MEWRRRWRYRRRVLTSGFIIVVAITVAVYGAGLVTAEQSGGFRQLVESNEGRPTYAESQASLNTNAGEREDEDEDNSATGRTPKPANASTEDSYASDSGSGSNIVRRNGSPTNAPGSTRPPTNAPGSSRPPANAPESTEPPANAPESTRPPTNPPLTNEWTYTPTTYEPPTYEPGTNNPWTYEPWTNTPTQDPSMSASGSGTGLSPDPTTEYPTEVPSGSSSSLLTPAPTPWSPPPVPNNPPPSDSPKPGSPSWSSDSDSSESAGSSSIASEDATFSPPPVTNVPAPTIAPSTPASYDSDPTHSASTSDSSDTSDYDTDADSPANHGSPNNFGDDHTPSPEPVTRPPKVPTHWTATSDDDTETPETTQTSWINPSYDLTTPSPEPITRPPLFKTMIIPSSPISPSSVGTVAPAKKSDTYDPTAESVKQTDLNSSDKGGKGGKSSKSKVANNSMFLLGNTDTTIIYSDGSKTTTFKRYSRGHGNLQSRGDGSGSYNNYIIGGSNRSNLPPGATISLSAAAQQMQNALLYASFALGIVSTVLLMFFHLLALHRPPWLGGSSVNSDQGGCAIANWFIPNVWELAVVVGYIQHINSISMLELTKAPQIVLDFTDSFSFVNLHLSSVAANIVPEASRRLQLIILTGIVAFSDRIGINEDKVLMNAFFFFLVIVAIVVMLFALAAGVTFYRHQMSTDTWLTFASALRNSFAMCVAGLGVAMWTLSIFPLVTMSSYELVMEMRYRVGIGLAVSLLSLWAIVVGGLCYAFVSVRAIPTNVAFRFQHFTVWGPLYGNSKMTFRYFFVVTASFQVLLGVVTGAVSGVPAQLVASVVTHLLFIVVAVIIRPFSARWVLGVVVGLRVMAIANLLCSFAFLTSSELSIEWRSIVAQGFVISNAIVFFLLFARYIIMFVMALKHWSGFTHRESLIHSHRINETEYRISSAHDDQTSVFMTYTMRENGQLNDRGRFTASRAGIACSRGPEYTSNRLSERSSRYSNRYTSTPAHLSQYSDRYASTPAHMAG